MQLLHTSTLKTAAIAAVIVGAGAVAGSLNYRRERSRLISDLIHETRTAAVAFDARQLDELARAPAVQPTSSRAATEERLRQLKAADARVRDIYLIRGDVRSGTLRLLADSTRAENIEPAAVSQLRDDEPGLKAVVAGRASGYAGPREDSTGAWVTGYARIGGGAANASISDILAVDMAADQWRRDLALAAFRGALYAWVLLGGPIFALLTTRRQGEQREAIRNLSEAVEQSHSAILILDLGHRIEYANRGACQQLGYQRRELLARHWRDFLTGPNAGPTIADLEATMHSGRPWEGDWMNLRKDGTAYPVHATVSPVKHRDESMACFVAIFDDVTEVKRKEAELREARDLAQAGDRAKGQFLATMSHEVRTPLNGIVGFTSLLLETPLSPEQREFVQTIRASGEALIQLTADILDYARIESGKLKLDPVAIDPRECVEEALDLHAAKAAEKKIELLHRAADNVPAAIFVDGGRLRQVLVNLIGNAVKFTERGEIEVTVRAAPAEHAQPGPDQPAGGAPAPWCRLEFTIRDTGIGIDPDHHGRLFKPFSQIDESSTRRYGGAGLGLAISKNLVQLMGGEIEVASAAGEGTTFTFTIHAPVAAAQPPQRQLDGLKLALAIGSTALRREMVDLLTSWGAHVREGEAPAELAGDDWDLALVEVTDASAEQLVGRDPMPGLPPEKTVALVPISLPAERRSALRAHFRLLINRPVHHGPLFALLSGSRPQPTARQQGPQFGLRVLIVEDNRVNQRLVQRVLASLGCTWQVVGNGREAIEELTPRADQYDVVLLDLHMPEMDGLSALERIRGGEAGARARSLWFIALTADVRPEQRARGFALGLNDYLTKPLRVPELEAALRRFLSERGLRTA
jgi:PAS domain S-box-containing protein